MTEILLPRFMNVGGGSLNQITQVLKKINCKRPFIITDKNMVKLEIIAPLLENLKSSTEKCFGPLKLKKRKLQEKRIRSRFTFNFENE